MGFLPDTVAGQIEEHVRRAGLVLLELRQRGQGQTAVLEVIVDHTERHITLDEVTELSRSVNALLDEVSGRIAGRYRLEVSTPGLGRPLEHEWQYRKNIGRLVKLTYRETGGAICTAPFRLLGFESGCLQVAVVTGAKGKKNAPADPVGIPLENVTKAIIEPEF